MRTSMGDFSGSRKGAHSAPAWPRAGVSMCYFTLVHELQSYGTTKLTWSPAIYISWLWHCKVNTLITSHSCQFTHAASSS